MTRTKYTLIYKVDEERWFNTMASRGWRLDRTSIFWWYHKFVADEPGETVVRIDNRVFTSADDREQYSTLMADAGWRLVNGPLPRGWGWWGRLAPMQYLVRMRPDADDDIFSDDASRALNHLEAARRSSVPLFVLLAVFLLCMLLQWISFVTMSRDPVDFDAYSWLMWIPVPATVVGGAIVGGLMRITLFHWRRLATSLCSSQPVASAE
ncbi:MAG: DUF2812 domain-containing protein [Micrococcales bacterium]|nr:DUF2812 domain-containing protein [Micrococcales bacterium]